MKNLSNRSMSQRTKLLDYLRIKHLMTLTARSEHPSARDQELREQGHHICTNWETIDTGQGKHRVASYILLGGYHG